MDVVIAYNAKFDREVLEKECERQGVELPKINWLCGLEDIEWEPHFRCKQLSHLCLDHGIEVDPSKLHGALADCYLFSELMERRKTKVEDMIAFRDDPWVVLAACMPKFDPELNEAAKADNYNWQTPRGTDLVFPKRWCKRVKQRYLETEKQKKLPFQREVL